MPSLLLWLLKNKLIYHAFREDPATNLKFDGLVELDVTSINITIRQFQGDGVGSSCLKLRTIVGRKNLTHDQIILDAKRAPGPGLIAI